ncbi:MAG: DMT family transporter [Gammaproteobacteria bacterium]|nr:DMT family transporter [Gammaproteobacteria bacterium]
MKNPSNPVEQSPAAEQNFLYRLQSLQHAWLNIPPNIRGALWVLLGALGVTSMYAVAKSFEGKFDTLQITFYRSVVGFLCVLIIFTCSRQGFRAVRTRQLKMHGLRSISGLSAMFCGFYAATHMPLAEATTIAFTSPLFVTVLAIFFLSESVQMWRWVATGVGFVGVIIVMRPGESGLSDVALVALLGAFLAASTLILIKKLPLNESPYVMLFYFGLIATLILLPFTLSVWKTPTLWESTLMIIGGLLGSLGQLSFVLGYRVGVASAIAPFDYSRLLFAGIIGALFFHEYPDIMGLLGAAIIIGSTLYIARREQKSRSQAAETDA